MSHVGVPYKYDLFVSYARAESVAHEPLLLNWSQQAATRIVTFLQQTFDPGKKDEDKVRVFLDERVIKSGDGLTDEIRQGVETSAFMLIILSPSYIASEWCMGELKCHFAKAKNEGRTRHCSIILAQPVPLERWPEELKDGAGVPLRYDAFCDEQSGDLPFGLDGTTDLQRRNTAILEVFKDLKARMVELRKKLEAQRLYNSTSRQLKPDRPVIYLYARPEDEAAWQTARTQLGTKAIVRPTALPRATIDVFVAAERKNKLKEYAVCHGLALLRTGDADIDLDVMTVYRDRNRLYQEHKINLPWAIVDQVGNDCEIADNYQVPRIMGSDSDWPTRLLRELQLR